jgi:hypothetical protein
VLKPKIVIENRRKPVENITAARAISTARQPPFKNH